MNEALVSSHFNDLILGRHQLRKDRKPEFELQLFTIRQQTGHLTFRIRAYSSTSSSRKLFVKVLQYLLIYALRRRRRRYDRRRFDVGLTPTQTKQSCLLTISCLVTTKVLSSGLVLVVDAGVNSNVMICFVPTDRLNNNKTF